MNPNHTVRHTADRPVIKLSVELLGTYKQINERYYERKRREKAVSTGATKLHNGGYDDEDGNYVFQAGEEIADRYIAQELLGKGSFGVVIKAHDHRRDEKVAIKVIKNKTQFLQQAQVEVDILQKLNQHCKEEHNIVKLKKVFRWKNHLCLVFELLAFNLYELLKFTQYRGVSLALIRKFAVQLLKTLEFLASPNVTVIHCDLKPENILLKNARHSGVKVIDFGSSCYVHRKMFKYIQSRFYRSPEVILGYSYNCAIDIWSLACILVEMHTGVPLFDGRDELDQLHKIAALMGPPPQSLVEHAPRRDKFYLYNRELRQWVLRGCKDNRSSYPSTSLDRVLGTTGGGPGGRRIGQPGHSEKDYRLFSDFTRRMLTYDPRIRSTSPLATSHQWLTLPASGTFDTVDRPLGPAGVEVPAVQAAPRRSKDGSNTDPPSNSTSTVANTATAPTPLSTSSSSSSLTSPMKADTTTTNNSKAERTERVDRDHQTSIPMATASATSAAPAVIATGPSPQQVPPPSSAFRHQSGAQGTASITPGAERAYGHSSPHPDTQGSGAKVMKIVKVGSGGSGTTSSGLAPAAVGNADHRTPFEDRLPSPTHRPSPPTSNSPTNAPSRTNSMREVNLPAHRGVALPVRREAASHSGSMDTNTSSTSPAGAPLSSSSHNLGDLRSPHAVSPASSRQDTRMLHAPQSTPSSTTASPMHLSHTPTTGGSGAGTPVGSMRVPSGLPRALIKSPANQLHQARLGSMDLSCSLGEGSLTNLLGSASSNAATVTGITLQNADPVRPGESMSTPPPEFPREGAYAPFPGGSPAALPGYASLPPNDPRLPGTPGGASSGALGSHSTLIRRASFTSPERALGLLAVADDSTVIMNSPLAPAPSSAGIVSLSSLPSA